MLFKVVIISQNDSSHNNSPMKDDLYLPVLNWILSRRSAREFTTNLHRQRNQISHSALRITLTGRILFYSAW